MFPLSLYFHLVYPHYHPSFPNIVTLIISILYLITDIRYVIVVEHDLSVLDYLSDFICCLYGTPGAYGVVTLPFSVREGTTSINESNNRSSSPPNCSSK